MATQDFKVEEVEGWKALPLNTKRFTQDDTGSDAYWGEAALVADLTGVVGEEIYPGVPYNVDATKTYFIRSPKATSLFGVTVE